jgi:hypothetical protein
MNIAPDKADFRAFLPILMFHYISDPPPGAAKGESDLYYPPKKLEAILAFLKNNNVATLTFWDLKDILEENIGEGFKNRQSIY